MGLRDRLAALEAPNRRTVEETRLEAPGEVPRIQWTHRDALGRTTAVLVLPDNGRESTPFPVRRTPL